MQKGDLELPFLTDPSPHEEPHHVSRKAAIGQEPVPSSTCPCLSPQETGAFLISRSALLTHLMAPPFLKLLLKFLIYLSTLSFKKLIKIV